MKSRGSDKRGDSPVSSIRGAHPVSRPLRADAAANRERILSAATELLFQRGLDVSLDEIAASAGVGPGTLHRHFPTKAALVDATIADGVTELARAATELAEARDPVAAFYSFFVRAIERGATSHALAQRLTGAGVDIDAAVATPVRELRAAFATLFRRAQRVGGIRAELEVADIDALLAAAHAIHVHPTGGRRLVEIFCDALRGPRQSRSSGRSGRVRQR